jgi:hypothetical protein
MKKPSTMKKTLIAIVAAAMLTPGCRRPVAPIITGKITDIQTISFQVGKTTQHAKRVKIMLKDKIYVAVTEGEQPFEIGQDINFRYIPVPKGKVNYNIFHHNAEEGYVEADMILHPEY